MVAVGCELASTHYRSAHNAGIPAQEYWAPIVAATGGAGDAQVRNDLGALE